MSREPEFLVAAVWRFLHPDASHPGSFYNRLEQIVMARVGSRRDTSTVHRALRIGARAHGI
jgi:hypothetical protein